MVKLIQLVPRRTLTFLFTEKRKVSKRKKVSPFGVATFNVQCFKDS